MLAAPAAPQQLRATWPHPQALRPELCWNEPTDQGGGGQDAVKIEKYLIWMHLMDGQVKFLDEVRDRLCFEVNLPELFSSTFRFSVTAVNQVYEGLRSNILELAKSGPPGTPGPIQIENITNDMISLSWIPPTTRHVPWRFQIWGFFLVHFKDLGGGGNSLWNPKHPLTEKKTSCWSLGVLFFFVNLFVGGKC